jgi:hypothetical protein
MGCCCRLHQINCGSHLRCPSGESHSTGRRRVKRKKKNALDEHRSVPRARVVQIGAVGCHGNAESDCGTDATAHRASLLRYETVPFVLSAAGVGRRYAPTCDDLHVNKHLGRAQAGVVAIVGGVAGFPRPAPPTA